MPGWQAHGDVLNWRSDSWRAVLAVTIGIFVGTLSLGRHAAPAASVARSANTTELT